MEYSDSIENYDNIRALSHVYEVFLSPIASMERDTRIEQENDVPWYACDVYISCGSGKESHNLTNINSERLMARMQAAITSRTLKEQSNPSTQ